MAHTTSPQITVVIPTHNRSKFLAKCLKSIEGQKLPRSVFNVIVIDDGSADETPETVREFQRDSSCLIEYRKSRHRGPATARNLGIRDAAGSVIAFIDDDCIADQDWLRNLRVPFEDPDVVGVEGKVVPQGVPTPLSHWVANSGGGQYLTANVAYRRDMLRRLGGFDEGYLVAGGEDYDLAYRVLDSGGRIAFEDRAVVYHPVYYQSFHQFMRRSRIWWSIVRLSRKHPRAFRKQTGRTGMGNILFYTTFYPAYQFFRWRGWFFRNPLDLPFYALRMSHHIYYGIYVLLRSKLGLVPKDAIS